MWGKNGEKLGFECDAEDCPIRYGCVDELLYDGEPTGKTAEKMCGFYPDYLELKAKGELW